MMTSFVLLFVTLDLNGKYTATKRSHEIADKVSTEQVKHVTVNSINFTFRSKFKYKQNYYLFKYKYSFKSVTQIIVIYFI